MGNSSFYLSKADQNTAGLVSGSSRCSMKRLDDVQGDDHVHGIGTSNLRGVFHHLSIVSGLLPDPV